MKAYRFIYLLGLSSLFVMILPSIILHTLWLMGGEGLQDIIRGRWDIAIINIVFFSVFLILIQYRRKVDWRSRNIYLAFIIALFAEMYGFPLTAYFMANYFGPINVGYRPAYSVTLSFLNTGFTLPTMMIIGSMVTITGLILIVLGWYGIYKYHDKLVTTGIYKFSRHPQYAGILLVTFGWILHWPTFLTLMMWPVLAISYYRLAKKEEKELKDKFPAGFERYRKETPMFI